MQDGVLLNLFKTTILDRITGGSPFNTSNPRMALLTTIAAIDQEMEYADLIVFEASFSGYARGAFGDWDAAVLNTLGVL